MSDVDEQLDILDTEDQTGRYWKWFVRRNGTPIGGFYSRADADSFVQSSATIARLTTALRDIGRGKMPEDFAAGKDHAYELCAGRFAAIARAALDPTQGGGVA